MHRLFKRGKGLVIKFIDMSNQVAENVQHFAWFNTESDFFYTLDSKEVWATFYDFEKAYNEDAYKNSYPSIEDFKKLFPVDRG